MKAAVSDSSEQGGNTGTYRVSRARRLRANRLEVGADIAQAVTATGAHAALGAFSARVLDLSIHGARIALALTPEQANVVLLGDRLDPLTISCDGRTIYTGVATIARALERDGRIEFGIELAHAAVEFDPIYRFHARQDAQLRWQHTRAVMLQQRIPASFRAWTTEVADFLETVKTFLDREEQTVSTLDRAAREAASEEILRAVSPDVVERLNLATHELGHVVATLPADAQPDYRAYVQSQLNKYLETSPFIRRAKLKPLGYAGDFEMMNMLYRDHHEGESLFGKAVNVFAAQLSAARANINRIEYIGAKIAAVVAAKPEGRVRIASIGCGPAHEIVAFLTKYPELGARLDVSLVDQEERALAQCQRTLAPLAARTNAKVRVINHSVRRLMTDRRLDASLGQCDMIYSAGLFDYLSERAFGVLLKTLYSAVVPGGTVMIGNVALHNPDRGLMEYVAEWFLQHRSPEQLLGYAAGAGIAPDSVTVESEPSGINLFLIAQR